MTDQTPSTPQPSEPTPPTVGQATSTGLDPQLAGLLCYILGIVTGVIFFLIEKTNPERDPGRHLLDAGKPIQPADDAGLAGGLHPVDRPDDQGLLGREVEAAGRRRLGRTLGG